MQKLFPAFPAGGPGIGLVLLRVAVASGAVCNGWCAWSTSSPSAWGIQVGAAFAILIGFALLVGIVTPIAGFASGLGYFALLASPFSSPNPATYSNAMTNLCLAVIAIALVLLGPGAFSFDARLFGPREIVIPGAARRTDE